MYLPVCGSVFVCVLVYECVHANMQVLLYRAKHSFPKIYIKLVDKVESRAIILPLVVFITICSLTKKFGKMILSPHGVSWC